MPSENSRRKVRATSAQRSQSSLCGCPTYLIRLPRCSYPGDHEVISLGGINSGAVQRPVRFLRAAFTSPAHRCSWSVPGKGCLSSMIFCGLLAGLTGALGWHVLIHDSRLSTFIVKLILSWLKKGGEKTKRNQRREKIWKCLSLIGVSTACSYEKPPFRQCYAAPC